MKVAIANSWVPFVSDGAEQLAEALRHQLQAAGHEAMIVKVPFRWETPEAILDGMVAAQLMQLPDVEKLIALKFPAYYIPHRNKTVWLLHQFRQVYDLWGGRYQDVPDSPAGRRVRDHIQRADNELFATIDPIYTHSSVTSDRLRRYNGFASTVLYPPLRDETIYFATAYEGYLFCSGRITFSNRQHLAIEAMRHVQTPVRLVVAGQTGSADDRSRLQPLLADARISSRVQLIDRIIPEAEKVELLSRALGCVYLPYDEDSYGSVTLEAFHARKPVVTCHDSGGTLILVDNGVTGHVVEPDPEELARAFDALYRSTEECQRMGDAGYRKAQQLHISWDRVLNRLLA